MNKHYSYKNLSFLVHFLPTLKDPVKSLARYAKHAVVIHIVVLEVVRLHFAEVRKLDGSVVEVVVRHVVRNVAEKGPCCEAIGVDTEISLRERVDWCREDDKQRRGHDEAEPL